MLLLVRQTGGDTGSRLNPLVRSSFQNYMYHQLVSLHEALCVLLICIMCKITLVSVLIILYLDYVVACLNCTL